MIEYECNKCGCIFSIEKQYIEIASKIDRYLCCPLGHRDIERTVDIEKLMQERSAVEL